MKAEYKRGCRLILMLLAVFSASGFAQAVAISEEPFGAALINIGRGGMDEREQGIEQLAATGNRRSLPILQALLNGGLYEHKASGKLVIALKTDTHFSISDAVTGSSMETADAPGLSKINVTNKIRGTLHKVIGQLQLSSDNVSVRLQAVRSMMKDRDEKALELLKNRIQIEQDGDILDAIRLVFLVRDLDSADKAVRINAIESLKDYNSTEVVNKLNGIMEKDSDGRFVEPDSDIRNAAELTLITINGRAKLYSSLETVFFGLSLGAVLVLAAIGLAITFGVMGVINMAHGELMMLGAYTTYVIQQMLPNHLGLSIFLAIPAAFIISAIAGMMIERGLIRFLYGRPLETLLATFGVSLILQQSVRSVFSPLNRSVATPEWMSGSWQINDFLSLTWNRLYILIFCLIIFALLLQILKYTRLGLEVRAVAQNRSMAKAMGIPTGRVDAMTFALGSGIAGVAGVALSQITNVGPNLGQAYIVDSFMVVVFGGVGNLIGTLVAGFSLGIANKFLEPYAGAVLAKILVLVFIILFIQKRPRGLFPQKGRAAEV
jgi:urea transport system permease protein